MSLLLRGGYVVTQNPRREVIRGDVLVELASVLRVRGDEEGAHEALDQAARLYERKGNVAAMALISL